MVELLISVAVLAFLRGFFYAVGHLASQRPAWMFIPLALGLSALLLVSPFVFFAYAFGCGLEPMIGCWLFDLDFSNTDTVLTAIIILTVLLPVVFSLLWARYGHT